MGITRGSRVGFGGSPKHDLRSQRSPLRDRFSSGKSARRSAFDNNYVTMRSVFLVGAIAFVVAGSVAAKENVGAGGAEENVRAVQSKLADEGCYFGEIDGAYSSDFSTALSRYQIRNGLPITGQLDAETSKALNAKPAIGPSTATTEQSSETWRQLRKRERRKSTKARQSEPAPTETSSPADNETPPTGTDTPIQTTPVEARSSAENTQPASAPPVAASAGEFSTDRLRDYVAAFVLAGLDKSVGAEAEFFADRVEYYDQGVMDREKIQQDLKRYDERWPERHFWVAGKINVEPQSENRVRVTFPLGFKLRNGNKQSSGKVDKTLVSGTGRRRSANRRGERTQSRLGRINQEARKPGKYFLPVLDSRHGESATCFLIHILVSWFPDRISYPRMNTDFLRSCFPNSF